MVRQLVCEGACNGGAVQEFDRAIRAASRVEVETDHGRRMNTSRVIDESVLELGRRLLHTSHVMVNGQIAQCIYCHTARKWIS
jgi:hypothetical protein